LYRLLLELRGRIGQVSGAIFNSLQVSEIGFQFPDGFEYKGIPVPKKSGVPRPGQIRFYPDPLVLPPEIMAGFERWPELYLNGRRWDFRIIDPRQEKFKERAIVQYAGSVDEVTDVLGRPTSSTKIKLSYPELNLYPEGKDWDFSDTVRVRILEGLVNAILLRTQDEEFSVWMFVFVDKLAISPE
jgi:hypothetical protein